MSPWNGPIMIWLVGLFCYPFCYVEYWLIARVGVFFLFHLKKHRMSKMDTHIVTRIKSLRRYLQLKHDENSPLGHVLNNIGSYFSFSYSRSGKEHGFTFKFQTHHLPLFLTFHSTRSFQQRFCTTTSDCSTSPRSKPICFRAIRWRGSCLRTSRIRGKMGCGSTCRKWISIKCADNSISRSFRFRSSPEMIEQLARVLLHAWLLALQL